MKRAYRVRRAADFQRARRSGSAVSHKLFVLHTMTNGLSLARCGIVASRKVGSAVVRNRIRRRVREVLRLLWANVPSGYDLIFTIRSDAVAHMPFEDMQRAVYDAVQRALAAIPGVTLLPNLTQETPSASIVPKSLMAEGKVCLPHTDKAQAANAVVPQPALAALAHAGISYRVISHGPDVRSAADFASSAGIDIRCVYKTLVLKDENGIYLLCGIPSAERLNVRALALLAERRKLSMVDAGEIHLATGYARGCVTPLGIVPPLVYYLDKQALSEMKLYLGTGFYGADVEVPVADLVQLLKPVCGALTLKEG